MNDYYKLQDQAHARWMEAQELIDRAERLMDHGKIDESEWYRMLADARSLQEAAIELEKIAADAQVLGGNVGKNNAGGGGAGHYLYAGVFVMICDHFTKFFGVFRVLDD